MKSIQICRWLIILTIGFSVLFHIIFMVLTGEQLPSVTFHPRGHQLESLNASLHQLNTKLREMLIIKDGYSNSKVSSLSPVIKPLKIPEVRKSTTINLQQIETNIPVRSAKSVLIFTMDSISSYEQNSNVGGAAGEILIRKCLQDAFSHFGFKLRVAVSDQDFESISAREYDIIILDPWTWAAKGWVPKRSIVGLMDRIYVLDFFGSKSRRGNGFNVPNNRVLTAFGSPWNKFLGYYKNESFVSSPKKQDQGVIWGKDPKHFSGKASMLQKVADRTHLVSTATNQVFHHKNVAWAGHMNTKQWNDLLTSSKFLLGLGDPLLGPSAIDAIIHGCVYINPIYSSPVRDGAFASQHPYAADRIGQPYVCSYHADNIDELMKCVQYALSADLKQFVPEDFHWANYLARVISIFNL